MAANRSPTTTAGRSSFGPDGMLYVGFGDGGGQGDPDRQRPEHRTLLGKILRIDSRATTRDAPTTTRSSVKPAVQARDLAVRRPQPLADSASTATTGDLWIGDVGRDRAEEIDRLAAEEGALAGRGVNLGWSLREGTADTGGAGDRSNLTDPLATLSHDDGWCAVIGGQMTTADAGRGSPGSTSSVTCARTTSGRSDPAAPRNRSPEPLSRS